jgi:[citrate (pro-3S)-lyase] ligase
LVVDSAYRGEGLLEQVVTALVDYQQTQGRTHLFVYTKYANVHIFTSLGFYEVASVAGETILMENRRDGFAKFISALGVPQVGTTSALIMNCNPFTLGHRYLVETAASENDIVHLFVVS